MMLPTHFSSKEVMRHCSQASESCSRTQPHLKQIPQTLKRIAPDPCYVLWGPSALWSVSCPGLVITVASAFKTCSYCKGAQLLTGSYCPSADLAKLDKNRASRCGSASILWATRLCGVSATLAPSSAQSRRCLTRRPQLLVSPSPFNYLGAPHSKPPLSRSLWLPAPKTLTLSGVRFSCCSERPLNFPNGLTKNILDPRTVPSCRLQT